MHIYHSLKHYMIPQIFRKNSPAFFPEEPAAGVNLSPPLELIGNFKSLLI